MALLIIYGKLSGLWRKTLNILVHTKPMDYPTAPRERRVVDRREWFHVDL